MTATTMRSDSIVGSGSGIPSVRRPPETPIFEALAHSWAAAGRVVPGQDDPEWTILAAYTVRPGP